MSSVKYIFFAYDVYKAVKRADEDLRSLGYSSSGEAIRDSFTHW